MGFLGKFFFYGIFVSAAGIFASQLIEFMDLHKVVHSNVPGPCKFVAGVENGVDDIAVLPSGIAILSTGLNTPKSALMMFNFSSPGTPVKTLKLSGFKGQLNAQGISLYTEGGETFVYVVNHPQNIQPPSTTVERFLLNLEKETLLHEKTFQDEEFLGLNDLVVVKKDKFYTSTFLSMKSRILREMETFFFLLPLQNVLYFDGKNATVVLSGRFGANGINVSPDKKFLYLAETTKKRISSFRIESEKRLIPIDTKKLGSLPDNVDVDPETGDLWIAAHPYGYMMMLKLFNFSPKQASQVLRIGVKNGKFGGSTEIFSDNGSILSEISVAVFFKKTVLFASFHEKLLHCQLFSFNVALKL